MCMNKCVNHFVAAPYVIIESMLDSYLRWFTNWLAAAPMLVIMVHGANVGFLPGCSHIGDHLASAGCLPGCLHIGDHGANVGFLPGSPHFGDHGADVGRRLPIWLTPCW